MTWKKKWEKDNWKKTNKKRNGIFTLKEGYLDSSTPFITPLYIKDKKKPVSFGQNTYAKVDKDNVKNVICVKCVNQAHV